jgi:hypothetical protein
VRVRLKEVICADQELVLNSKQNVLLNDNFTHEIALNNEGLLDDLYCVVLGAQGREEHSGQLSRLQQLANFEFAQLNFPTCRPDFLSYQPAVLVGQILAIKVTCSFLHPVNPQLPLCPRLHCQLDLAHVRCQHQQVLGCLEPEQQTVW